MVQWRERLERLNSGDVQVCVVVSDLGRAKCLL